ncbi:hypothetical protein BGZ54_004177 [Gamsiella multidivaricata]|nr:hypothetical protein BGZ54_004177 [Gamsiella multidivaricata]
MKEKDLLSKFLVGNELHDSVTLQQFKTFFPSSYRSHPEVNDLYRAYLNARHQARSKVRRNIDIEVRRNPYNLDQQARSDTEANASSTAAQSSDIDLGATDTDAMDIEDVDKHLTLDQAIQELLQAESIFKREIGRLEKECDEFVQEFQDLDREMDAVKAPENPAISLSEQSLMEDLQTESFCIV